MPWISPPLFVCWKASEICLSLKGAPDSPPTSDTSRHEILLTAILRLQEYSNISSSKNDKYSIKFGDCGQVFQHVYVNNLPADMYICEKTRGSHHIKPHLHNISNNTQSRYHYANISRLYGLDCRATRANAWSPGETISQTDINITTVT